MKKVVISARSEEKRIAILNENKLEDLYIDRPSETEEVGDIFIGRVEKVVPGLEAAFLDIGMPKNGFLQKEKTIKYNEQIHINDKRLSSISEAIQGGQYTFVQIEKEGFGTKGAKLTEIVEISGKYIVYMPHGNYVAVSKKIEDSSSRENLHQIAEEQLKTGEGIIFRTASKDVDAEAIIRELHTLQSKWEEIVKNNVNRKSPCRIYQTRNFYDYVLRDDILSSCTEVIVDHRDVFFELKERLAGYHSLELSLHKEKEEIFSYYQMEAEIDKLCSEHVWLPNGASLKIEQTEAFTIIDVNSTKFTGKGNKEELILKVNHKAALEIANQLRKRNIGGMILVDFINMKTEEAKSKIIKALQHEFKKDRLYTKILGFTNLGLLEMTRKKEQLSLVEKLTSTCHTCNGTGYVYSAETVSFRLERALWEYKGMDEEAVWVEVPAEVFDIFTKNNHIEQLQNVLHFNIYISVNNALQNYVIRHIGSVAAIKERLAEFK